MAANLLPLLALGGAAAYVVTSEKKKAKAKECPASSNVGLGQFATVAMAAYDSHGKDPDPSKEISYYMKELLPKGCTIANNGSSITMTRPGAEKSIHLTIPDFYAFMTIAAWSRRLQEGVVTQEQWIAALADLSKWYKSVTGENLDVLKLKEFALSMMDSVEESKGDGSGNGNGNGSAEPEGPICPPVFEYVYDDQEDAKMAAAFDQGRQMYPNDPFKIADVTFAATAPPGCTKRDFNTKVIMTMKPPGGSPSGYEDPALELDMASMYAVLVMEAAHKIGLSPSQINVIASKVADNYQALTGKPLSL